MYTHEVPLLYLAFPPFNTTSYFVGLRVLLPNMINRLLCAQFNTFDYSKIEDLQVHNASLRCELVDLLFAKS